MAVFVLAADYKYIKSKSENGGVAVVEDFTKIPQELDQKFESFDIGNSLRPTIITPGMCKFCN